MLIRPDRLDVPPDRAAAAARLWAGSVGESVAWASPAPQPLLQRQWERGLRGPVSVLPLLQRQYRGSGAVAVVGGKEWRGRHTSAEAG